MITIEDIEKSNEVTNIIVSTLNDWPHPVESLIDFEKQVSAFIKSETNAINIKKSLNQIDFSKHPWEAESLTQLLKLFTHFNECKNLKCIFENLGKIVF